MATIVLVAPPFLGHLNPMGALGRTLSRRGHRVLVLALRDAAPRVRAQGLEALVVGQGSLSGWSLAAAERRMRRTSLLGVPGLVRDMVAATRALCAEGPQALAAHAPDAIVGDQLEPAGGLIARRLAVPLVSVANALPIDEEPDIPPPYVGWSYAPTEWGRRRNAGGRRVSGWLMKPLSAEIGRWAAAWDLGPLRSVADCLSPERQIAQSVAGLDFPRLAPPAGLVHAGPFRDTDDVWEDPRPGDGRPLVYCSLGTLQGDRAALFRAVARACHALGLRLVIAHGGKLGDGVLAGLPGDPLVYAHVPQRAVLARAAAAVCHAGFNTVMDALSFGVPMVLMPLGFEQPGTAARVERAGVGLVARHPRAGTLRDALEAVVGMPGFATRAGRLRAEIAQAGGVTRAADLVEASLV